MLETLVFTGTKAGTTPAQFEAIDYYLPLLVMAGVSLAVHGLGPGADYDFHRLCLKHEIPMEGYPSIVKPNVHQIPASDFVVLHRPNQPLARNHDMIDYAMLSYDQMLVTAPRRDHEELRSGTWATVRYARSYGMTVAYVWPSDGIVEIRDPGSPHYHSRNRHE